MAYIFITNNSIDVKDMLDNKKASAYLPYTGPKVEKIIKNDLIFIYRTESGIIAYGYSNGQNIINRQCNSGLKSTHEDYVILDKFIVLKTPITFSFCSTKVLRVLLIKFLRLFGNIFSYCPITSVRISVIRQ